MESIRQAIERAKSGAPNSGMPETRTAVLRENGSSGVIERNLRKRRLRAKRIIAHDALDPRANAFDMLCGQVLREMDKKHWQTLAVTSPTAGCGKTLIATNLAFSMACHRERSVMLADMDLRKPQVAKSLRLKHRAGVLGVLEGQSSLSNALVEASLGKHRLLILPTERPTAGSAELMGSRAMGTLLQQIKRQYPSRVMIVDLPPMLSSDDVVAFLPWVDCVLLVCAAGVSTLKEFEQCKKQLQSTNLVRVVLNKVPEASMPNYYTKLK
jgi:protein-tyrosine kinase